MQSTFGGNIIVWDYANTLDLSETRRRGSTHINTLGDARASRAFSAVPQISSGITKMSTARLMIRTVLLATMTNAGGYTCHLTAKTASETTFAITTRKILAK
jgi:hypothetical protein